MAYLYKNMLFVHIPKTGGTYIRSVFKALGYSGTELGHEHSHISHITDLVMPIKKDIYAWCMIRHPKTWYQSFWAFRCQRGWSPSNPIDFKCASNDFNTFVNNCIEHYPQGLLTSILNNHIQNDMGINVIVKKYESLHDELNSALQESGIKNNLNAIPRLNRVNASILDNKPSSHFAIYEDVVFKKMIKAEKSLIDTYYEDTFIDFN